MKKPYITINHFINLTKHVVKKIANSKPKNTILMDYSDDIPHIQELMNKVTDTFKHNNFKTKSGYKKKTAMADYEVSYQFERNGFIRVKNDQTPFYITFRVNIIIGRNKHHIARYRYKI
jgi:hypothetical protein